MSEVKTGYFVDGGNGHLYRRLHCATEESDFIDVGNAVDQDLQFCFNMEMSWTQHDESGDRPSINLTPDTAKLLIQDLEAYIREAEEGAEYDIREACE
ncbi:hypothetical protein DIRTYBETTY_196 [Bacillus phage DirtyBetty]|uniref:Uncharacterized protein n=2 Tax=Wphvirus megatron TaxID=1987728 RepID=A0A1B1PAU3_9CAUD|nr:hypothetical protein QLX47_gp194 [Bacillus phage Eyuki]YP_009285138.1 hypothetical protein BIZ88_gp196 [Bacillus phage DirtyBetty]ALA46647.1 hypothetical protein EYUKI_194 [Bacillus phage Eyuki]ANT41281.1 hypothetical protein DIRTYBETTY_196 [Bacillus phage DirtyBetty]